MRRPDSWYDLIVELRAIDSELALVLAGDQLERIPLVCLRRR
jgi:hypothetical protein